MKVIIVIACLIAGTFLLWAASAHAMGMCGPRADFLTALKDKYQETGKAIGIAGQVNLVEIFASKAGTWTILVTTPEGKSCIIATGISWEELPPQIKEDET